MEMACVQPKFSSFDQISLTRIGFTANGSGACLAGKKNSLTRSVNPPKPAPQFTSRPLFPRDFGTGRELKNSLKLSATPAPNAPCVKGTPLRSVMRTGRSVKNCLKLDQKLSEIR